MAGGKSSCSEEGLSSHHHHHHQQQQQQQQRTTSLLSFSSRMASLKVLTGLQKGFRKLGHAISETKIGGGGGGGGRGSNHIHVQEEEEEKKKKQENRDRDLPRTAMVRSSSVGRPVEPPRMRRTSSTSNWGGGGSNNYNRRCSDISGVDNKTSSPSPCFLYPPKERNRERSPSPIAHRERAALQEHNRESQGQYPSIKARPTKLHFFTMDTTRERDNHETPLQKQTGGASTRPASTLSRSISTTRRMPDKPRVETPMIRSRSTDGRKMVVDENNKALSTKGNHDGTTRRTNHTCISKKSNTGPLYCR